MRIHVSVQTNHFFGNINTQKMVAKEKNLRTEEYFVYLCIGVSGQRHHSLKVIFDKIKQVQDQGSRIKRLNKIKGL